jgi:SOS-response transcriptional repressor LexA
MGINYMAIKATDIIPEHSSTSPNVQLLKNLRHLMHLNNITEAELARQTNNPQATIHKIVSGKTADPRISTLQSIADYFRVTLDDLTQGSPSLSTESPISKIKTQFIPLINWDTCVESQKFLQSLSSTNWDNWIPTQNMSQHAYGLLTKASMEPRFPRGTMLLIEPQKTLVDGDLVVVHYPETQEATLRELLLDGPNQYLASINDRTEREVFKNSMKILGTMTEFRFSQNR